MWGFGKNKLNGSVRFEKHPPERRRAGRDQIMCNGGCCCCSCCLHTLGGLIGAAIGSEKNGRTEGKSIVPFYWAALGLMTIVVLIVSSQEGNAAGIIGTLIFLPLLQLGSSVMCLFWIGIRRAEAAEKKANLARLGQITLWGFLGALAGVFLMYFGFMVLSSH